MKLVETNRSTDRSTNTASRRVYPPWGDKWNLNPGQIYQGLKGTTKTINKSVQQILTEDTSLHGIQTYQEVRGDRSINEGKFKIEKDKEFIGRRLNSINPIPTKVIINMHDLNADSREDGHCEKTNKVLIL